MDCQDKGKVLRVTRSRFSCGRTGTSKGVSPLIWPLWRLRNSRDTAFPAAASGQRRYAANTFLFLERSLLIAPSRGCHLSDTVKIEIFQFMESLSMSIPGPGVMTKSSLDPFETVGVRSMFAVPLTGSKLTEEFRAVGKHLDADAISFRRRTRRGGDVNTSVTVASPTPHGPSLAAVDDTAATTLLPQGKIFPPAPSMCPPSLPARTASPSERLSPDRRAGSRCGRCR